MDDKDIIKLYLDRDEEAIRQTEIKYAKMCYGIARRVLRNEQDAEECVNDTYLGIWNAIPPEQPRQLSAFVAKIVRNLSLKRLEYNSAGKRQAPELIEFSELAEVLADDSVPDGHDEELGRLISEFLRTERELSRDVFMRKYWYFDTVEQIARRHGCSESRIKSMLHQTRKRMKRHLTEKGVFL